ncbi:MAG: non-homologous end-joining DNA ligase [Acidimicrobiales bacterium]
MSGSSLDTYRAKRRAGATPEPVPSDRRRPRRGRGQGSGAGDGRRFVIQEHHARALHWDFRLERDGVLVSWALPKGLPVDPKQNHLAVHTEDHPLEYLGFEGEIPAGEYGGGQVTIWDRGTYECEKWSDREVMVVLSGSMASGRYALFRTDRSGDDRSGDGTKAGRREQWMIHRMDPTPTDWEPMPALVRPMLCRTGGLPAPDEEWSFEFKWDGVRAVVYVDGGRVRITSRNDLDVTVSYPELRALGEALGSRPAVLDGEIIALDADGRPSFRMLQRRMHVGEAARARRLAARVPATYLVFDVLYLDGHRTTGLPYDERWSLLESLDLEGPAWATPPAFPGGPGADVLRAARERGLEGVVAKRRDAPYAAGRRSDRWVKVKNFRTQEVVIGGWTPGQGRRGGTIGALLLGIPSPSGLAYVGKVGTGFTDRLLADTAARLRPLTRTTSPFADPLPKAEVAGAVWVRPSLVGEVQFAEWTDDGRLRHPSWRGLRPDKAASEVAVEPDGSP